jgi:hypothetical protein
MLALGVGIVSVVVLYLSSGAIENDHFVIYSRAMQVVGGDWPVRDFEDPGMPAAYLVQALVAWAFGASLLVNVVFAVTLIALTAGITALLAARASGQIWLALALTSITVLVSPRLYNATKVLMPIVATWLAWTYVDRPTARQAALLGAWAGLAGLVRYDYLVYILTTIVALLPARRPGREGLRHASLCVAVALACLLPWLVFVQFTEGLSTYFSTALAFVAAEGRRTAGTPSRLLFSVAMAWPVLGLVRAWMLPASPARWRLAYVGLLTLLTSVVLLRDNLATRVPDVLPLYAVLTAALTGRLPAGHASRALGAGVLAAAVVLMVATGRVPWSRLAALPEFGHQAGRVTERLRTAAPEIQPNPGLAPLVAYLSRCTPREGRVLIGGFAPELPVLAGRMFASGVPYWLPGYYDDAGSVARARARLDHEHVSIAVLVDGATGFRQAWPALASWFDERRWQEYAPTALGPRLRVWLPPSPAATSLDPSTSLPCPTV